MGGLMIDYVLLEEYCQNISILFIEDDESIKKETTELLKEIFTCVDVASNGEEGLDKYKEYFNINQKHYDIVLSDIKMPKIDGLELTKLIYKENPDQKIIVLSAHSETKYLLEFVNIGISYFLVKPLDYDEFITVIFNITKEIHDQNELRNNFKAEKIVLNNILIWDKQTKQLLRNNQAIKLTKKEFLLIELLLKTIEKTHPVEEIIAILWEGDYESSADITNLKNIVSRLRKKVPELDIENVYGFGYKINIRYFE
ncbi:transcriptional regulator [Malaciobacter marinus]|uniref:Transcriptional regulator n=2 Tax=Malaciobacter marinus TaxID=505249 RepID=A0ABX4LXH4_9BACT|nr:transcriptional regulator [Malaciobacter marinus]PHO15181.1 transcriptional regulator [Malaciobacter marinus]